MIHMKLHEINKSRRRCLLIERLQTWYNCSSKISFTTSVHPSYTVSISILRFTQLFNLASVCWICRSLTQVTAHAHPYPVHTPFIKKHKTTQFTMWSPSMCLISKVNILIRYTWRDLCSQSLPHAFTPWILRCSTSQSPRWHQSMDSCKSCKKACNWEASSCSMPDSMGRVTEHHRSQAKTFCNAKAINSLKIWSLCLWHLTLVTCHQTLRCLWLWSGLMGVHFKFSKLWTKVMLVITQSQSEEGLRTQMFKSFLELSCLNFLWKSSCFNNFEAFRILSHWRHALLAC